MNIYKGGREIGDTENDTRPWKIYRVSKDRRFHVKEGKPLYEARYDEVMPFHPPGLAPARIGDKWFHIKDNGERAYSKSFDRVWGFYEGFASVILDDLSLHITIQGEPAYEPRFAWTGNFQAFRCAVRFLNGRYGHILPDGRHAYNQTYRYAGDFREGYAVVQTDDGMHMHIDCDGISLNGMKFTDLGPFHKGFAAASDSRGWYHTDERGEPLYESRFSFVEPFYNGQSRVGSKNGGIFVISEAGEVIATLLEDIRTPLENLSHKMVGYWETQTIYSAVELGLFDVLPGTADDISRYTALPLDSTKRLLRGLWELELIELFDENWVATETGSLLRVDSKYDMASSSWNWASLHYPAWSHLTEALKTGKSGYEIANGKKFFQSLIGNSENSHRYQRAMKAYADHDYESVAGLIRTDTINEVVDAGGGLASLLFLLVGSNPNLRGALFDLPEVVSQVIVPESLRKRVKVIPGNILDDWPVRSELIIMSRILHDWSDNDALKILQNAKKSLLSGGRIYLIEMVTSKQSPEGSLLDLNMLVITGGRERNFTEFVDLIKSAGLIITNIEKARRFGSLIELKSSD